jgi:hypothetical protein
VIYALLREGADRPVAVAATTAAINTCRETLEKGLQPRKKADKPEELVRVHARRVKAVGREYHSLLPE